MSKQECPQHQEPDNGQAQPQQKADPMIKSSLTLDEILEILDDISCDYKVHESKDDLVCYVDCEMFDCKFIIYPWGLGPFYTDFSLEAMRCPELDPETLCTEFNKSQLFASAVPFDLNENDAEDDSSDFVIAIKRDVSLDGGVTNEFVKRTIEVWVDMLLSTQGFFEGPTVEAIDGDDTE